jgi:hypothetical protein
LDITNNKEGKENPKMTGEKDNTTEDAEEGR